MQSKNSSKITNFNKDTINQDLELTSKLRSKSLIAGILLILAGILAIVNWALVATSDISTFTDISQLQEISPEISIETIEGFLSICASIGIIISIITILSGIFTIKTKIWTLSIIGGILGLFLIGPILISSILSLIALILILLSRKEFNN